MCLGVRFQIGGRQRMLGKSHPVAHMECIAGRWCLPTIPRFPFLNFVSAMEFGRTWQIYRPLSSQGNFLCDSVFLLVSTLPYPIQKFIIGLTSSSQHQLKQLWRSSRVDCLLFCPSFKSTENSKNKSVFNGYCTSSSLWSTCPPGLNPHS